MDVAAELGRNPVSNKHQIQSEYGDEQADAGRDCRTRLARPNSQARTRAGNIRFACSADHVQDWQPHPVDPYSCCMCGHTIIIPCLNKNKNLNTCRPSEHIPQSGGEMSKRLGGIIGCKDKTSWHLNGFPHGSNIIGSTA